MVASSQETFGVVVFGIAMATCDSHLNYDAKVQLIFVFAIANVLIFNVLKRTKNYQVCST